MYPAERSRVIEVPITGTADGLQFKFPDQPDLVHAIVESVETYDSTTQTVGESGATVVSAADAVNLVVIIQDKSDEKVQLVPYQAFNTVLNSGEKRNYRNLVINWESCKVQTVAPLAASGTVALVQIDYRLPSDPPPPY